jgi:chemosensory pili system protein ChpA (sensor histidine kinase/response regulator)
MRGTPVSRKLALVVDDDPFTVELLQALLEPHGFEVDTATDGIDVVEHERAYDVILLDLKMPILDGARLVAYWALTRPEILKRVIVLSGYSRDSISLDFATFSIIGKPFEPLALLATVDRCVAQGKASELVNRFTEEARAPDQFD